MHADGTYGYYGHIKYNGSKLKPGDGIQKGSIIGDSGNVGWSSGPHLHFAILQPAFDKWQTLETKFRIDNGEHVVLLMEGKEYKRDY